MRFRKKRLRWERTGYHVVAAQQDTNIEFYVIWGGGSNAGGKGWGRVGRVEVWGWLVDLAGSPGSPSPPQWPLISQVVSPLCTQHTVTHTATTQDSWHSASWGGDVVHLAPHCLLYGGVLWRKGWQVAAMPVRNNQARCSEDKRGSGPGNDGSAAASALTDCHQNRNRCKHPFLLCLCTREPNSPHNVWLHHMNFDIWLDVLHQNIYFSIQTKTSFLQHRFQVWQRCKPQKFGFSNDWTDNMWTIIKHIEVNHINRIKLPCNICGTNTPSRQTLSYHMCRFHKQYIYTFTLWRPIRM